MIKNIRLIVLCTLCTYRTYAQSDFKSWAEKPPMGWNSYDAYYGNITESQFKTEVDVLAKKLLPYGYEYAIVDYCWFNPGPKGWDPKNWKTFNVDRFYKSYGKDFAGLSMDKYGRLLPAHNRFPSSAAGKGFKPIADYVHGRGMKFGIHIMRGIAREAVDKNLPVLGTNYRAQDIVNRNDSCKWNESMYGVDYRKPGAQEYYNSLFNLYASWGVDFIKVDDIASPVYHKGEIDLIRKAIDQCGRNIVLSLSPGDALLGYANHADQNTNMYRVSNDVWDRWEDILHIFDLTNSWSPFIGGGSWPDADMLPFGKLCLTGYPVAQHPGKPERTSLLSLDEQRAMFSLWCFARSPLMWGGSAVHSEQQAFDVLSNTALLEIQKNSTGNHQLYQPKQRADFKDFRIWVAESADGKTKYVALFNLREEPASLSFKPEWEFWEGPFQATELWTDKRIQVREELTAQDVAAHGVAVFKLTNTEVSN